MLYQNFVSYYPPMALPGEAHNNGRHTFIYRSAVNQLNEVEAGTGQIVIGNYDHTRLNLANPSASNIVAGTNYLVLVAKSISERGGYSENRNFIGSTASTSNNTIPQFEHIRALVEGIEYVIVEKAINTNNGVYVRVANPVGTAQKIGYFTDTASADVVLIPNARWYGVDTATYLATKDAAITPAAERSRIGMNSGFGVAPLQLRFGNSQPQ